MLCADCHPNFGNQLALYDDWRDLAKLGLHQAVEDAKEDKDETPNH